MEAESAGAGPEADGIVLVQIQKSETGESRQRRFTPKAGTLETQGEPTFQLQSKEGKSLGPSSGATRQE